MWPRVASNIITGICSGLHYLHMKHNIAHLDLKPENILLGDNMVAKIADFGTSRLIDQNMTRNPIGTVGYMAPEYRVHGSISPKADIFSLGVIILELMTGSLPEYPLNEEYVAALPNKVVEKWGDRLSNAAYSQQVHMCVSIAIECVNYDKDRRPTTGCIIKRLNEVQESIRILLMQDALESVQLDPNAEPIKLQLPLHKVLTNNCIGGFAALILLNPSGSWSLVVLALKISIALVALLAIGVAGLVATHLILIFPNLSTGSRMLFATGYIVTAALIILNPSSSWSWVVLTLKVITALLELQDEYKYLCATIIHKFPNTKIWQWITLFVVLVLLNPSSSRAWVLLALEVLTPLVTLLAIEVASLGEMASRGLFQDSPSPRTWLQMTKLNAVKASESIMVAVLVQLKTRSSWSRVGMTTLNVVKALITLFVLGSVDRVDISLQDFRILLFSIKAKLTTILGVVRRLLNPGNSWSRVVTNLEVIMTLVALLAIGCTPVLILVYLSIRGPRSSWKLVVLFAIVAIVMGEGRH